MKSTNHQLSAQPGRPAIIVMAKSPRAGEAKTRLSPALTPEEAAALAACFVKDAVAGARRLTRNVILAYTPFDGRAAPEALLPGDLLWQEQCSGDLGARLDQAIQHAATFGYSPLIVIGTDSPTLPSALTETAIEALRKNQTDLVLGPTEDGGYYLVGLQKPVPYLFEQIAWSTPQTYDHTLRNAQRMKLRVLRLPVWYDVDTPADLIRLRDEINSDSKAQRRAPSTYEWLCAHK